MSAELFHRANMTATRYTGPARPDGGTRERVQLYNHEHAGDSRGIDLSAEQWEALARWFAEQRHPSSSARTSSPATATSSPARGAGSA